MSRVGKLPVEVPSNVKVAIEGLSVTVSGPKGELNKTFQGDISIGFEDNRILVTPLNKEKSARAMWGTARSIIKGMVTGVTEGFKHELEINGVGYRAAVKSGYLNLSLGKSHNTKIAIPADITVDAPKQNVVTVEGISKERLGQFVALVIKQRPPEPYKGKGIKRKGQYVQRKEGKKG